jgi:hypothetical protein
MPPAFVLSQDQTLKFVSRHHGTSFHPPTAAPNFRSRYLHLSNVMDTKDMYKASTFQPVTGAQRPPDRAPSPTCPFIKTNNVKDPTDKHRRTTITPRSLHLGGLAVRLSWRPANPLPNGSVPSGEAPSNLHPRVGQPTFCRFVAIIRKLADFRGF